MLPDTMPDTLLQSLLTSDGDARLVIDPRSGRNKYLCPPLPTPDITCFASCTASPISVEGYHAAAACLERLGITATATPDRLARETLRLEERVAQAFGVADLADIVLAPSGTDATVVLIGLLAAERPGVPIVSILAAAAETGSGIPLAAGGRQFSERTAGARMVPPGERVEGFPDGTEVVCIPLRTTNGAVRSPDDIDGDYVRAVAQAPGRAIVHLIDGSKTGLVAPGRIPDGVEVVVDACQARLPVDRLRGYLARGWPVLVTGSKFYGGPAFSGAVLFPRARLAAIDLGRLPRGIASTPGVAPGRRDHLAPAGAGTLLRWAAALAEMDAFAAIPAPEVARRVAAAGRMITDGLAAIAMVAPLDGPADPRAPFGLRTIFGFTVQERGDRGGLLSTAALRVLYQRLAGRGMLLGQPVQVGDNYGALRIAIGARNIRSPSLAGDLASLFQALEQEIASRPEPIP